jgi:hypothetical protein
MENPTIVKPISSKIVLSSADNVPYGAGIKTFQVNPLPVTDILTTQSNKQASGAKYITDNIAADFTIGNMPYITDVSATVWTAIGSTAGLTQTINIIGVNASNEEVTENITLNGTTPVSTTYSYKCVNDIKMVSGGAFGAGVYCYVIPSGGSPDLRVVLFNNSKSNPYIMVGSKNGVSRKARLRSINSVLNTTASTNLNCHVFLNNTVQPATNKGVHIPSLRMMEVPVGTSQGITFPDDGVVELNMGEMAVWYREGASTVATYMACTWSYHNV